MTKQQNLHRVGLSAVADLERLIDRLKEAGPCPLDGRNALMNLREQVQGLLNRLPDAPPQGNWNPDMSEAPTTALASGRRIEFLGWCPNEPGHGIVICWWEPNRNSWLASEGYTVEPTQWQSLPQRPAKRQRKAEGR